MAVSPAAEQIPQASDPLAAPPATRAPVRRPPSSELRSTSRLSGPGVTVTISDKTANAATLVIIALPAFPGLPARAGPGICLRLHGNILRTANVWQYNFMKSRDRIAATVGSNIRRLRLDRSLTLAGLAEQAGTSVRTLV